MNDFQSMSWLAAAAIAFAGVVVALGTAGLVRWLGARVLGDAERAGRFAAIVAVATVALFGIAAVSRLVEPDLTEPGLRAATARVLATLPELLIAIVVVVAAVILASALRGLLRRILEPVRPGLAELAATLAYWALIGLGLLIAADQVGIQTGFLQQLLLVLLAGVIVGLAIAFGLGSRDLVAAVVAGRHVAQIVALDDEIEVDGHRGTVVELGHASVRVRLSDGRQAEIPNARLLGTTVVVHGRVT